MREIWPAVWCSRQCTVPTSGSVRWNTQTPYTRCIYLLPRETALALRPKGTSGREASVTCNYLQRSEALIEFEVPVGRRGCFCELGKPPLQSASVFPHADTAPARPHDLRLDFRRLGACRKGARPRPTPIAACV